MVDHAEADDPVEIVSQLYLGSWRSSRMLDRLTELNVGLVVNCAAELENVYPETFEYIHLELRDVPTASIATMYEYLASNEMHKQITSGSSILVHCQAGVSRSVSIVIFYLIEHRRMTLKDALDTVRAVRRDACPNYGFFSQLQAFEKKKLGSISIEMNEYIQNVLLEPFELSLDAIDRAIVGSHGDVGKALMTLTTAYMNDLK